MLFIYKIYHYDKNYTLLQEVIFTVAARKCMGLYDETQKTKEGFQKLLAKLDAGLLKAECRVQRLC